MTIAFLAPNGVPIAGAEQNAGQYAWPVHWTDPTDPVKWEDYAEDGPGVPDWETTMLGGYVIWIDEEGENWLSRHLIPADAEPLPPEAVALAERDVFSLIAHYDAARLVTSLEQAAKRGGCDAEGKGPVGDLIRAAVAVREDCRTQSYQLGIAFDALRKGLGR